MVEYINVSSRCFAPVHVFSFSHRVMNRYMSAVPDCLSNGGNSDKSSNGFFHMAL